MLLRNLELTGNDRMLVNGSRGVITKFIPKTVRMTMAWCQYPFPILQSILACVCIWIV